MPSAVAQGWAGSRLRRGGCAKGRSESEDVRPVPIDDQGIEIAPLNGDYAQWYFLSNDVSVIIAVNLGGEPNVVAWDTETGERRNLGNYRECERPQPDMARLTEDGSTLIIGCDTGLDIWRINEEE